MYLGSPPLQRDQLRDVCILKTLNHFRIAPIPSQTDSNHLAVVPRGARSKETTQIIKKVNPILHLRRNWAEEKGCREHNNKSGLNQWCVKIKSLVWDRAIRGEDSRWKWVVINRDFRSAGSRGTPGNDWFYILSPWLLGSIGSSRSAGLNLSLDRLMALLLYLSLPLLPAADNGPLCLNTHPPTPSVSWLPIQHTSFFSPR